MSSRIILGSWRMARKITFVLTEEEYEALLEGKLKLRRDIKIRFRRFKITPNVAKVIERMKNGSKGEN